MNDMPALPPPRDLPPPAACRRCGGKSFRVGASGRERCGPRRRVFYGHDCGRCGARHWNIRTWEARGADAPLRSPEEDRNGR